jgi:hypothetical protein
MADGAITHAEALDLIEEHIGEQVYMGFLVAGVDDRADDIKPVQHLVGELENPLEPRPPRLEPDFGYTAERLPRARSPQGVQPAAT